MILIIGGLYSGKRTFAQKLGGSCRFEVQQLAADADNLPQLAEELSAYDVLTATEQGCGVVPTDAAERYRREQAGRLNCLLAAKAETVVQMYCGIPTVLKGALPLC